MKTPSYDNISRLAASIWHDRGSPSGCDDEIWLEAERQLSATTAPAAPAPAQTFTERAKTETAAESVVEYHISPALPDQEAIQAALQKQEARAPQVPHHTGPKGKPPETGKPLWNKPHSS